jgi:hypothetical protein
LPPPERTLKPAIVNSSRGPLKKCTNRRAFKLATHQLFLTFPRGGDSEAVGPLGSAIADAVRFKGGVTSADRLTDLTWLPSKCSGPEHVSPPGDMVAAGGHRPGRFNGVVPSGGLLATSRAAVGPLAELQSWTHSLSAGRLLLLLPSNRH